jgi:hypothetical protein
MLPTLPHFPFGPRGSTVSGLMRLAEVVNVRVPRETGSFGVSLIRERH